MYVCMYVVLCVRCAYVMYLRMHSMCVMYVCCVYACYACAYVMYVCMMRMLCMYIGFVCLVFTVMLMYVCMCVFSVS